MLGFFPLGVLELLSLLSDLELLLPAGDPGKLICNTFTEIGGETGELGPSSDLEQKKRFTINLIQNVLKIDLIGKKKKS